MTNTDQPQQMGVQYGGVTMTDDAAAYTKGNVRALLNYAEILAAHQLNRWAENPISVATMRDVMSAELCQQFGPVYCVRLLNTDSATWIDDNESMGNFKIVIDIVRHLATGRGFIQ